nr:hypothetical protein [Daphnis nerii cypovirus]UGZ05867.1 putative polyhedrin [Clanis bilineata cypovirus]
MEAKNVRQYSQNVRKEEIIQRKFSSYSLIYVHVCLRMKDNSLLVWRFENPRIISTNLPWHKLCVPNHVIDDGLRYGRNERRQYRDGLAMANRGRAQVDYALTEPVEFTIIFQGDVCLQTARVKFMEYDGIPGRKLVNAHTAVALRAEDYIAPILQPMEYYGRTTAYWMAGKFDGCTYPRHPSIGISAERQNHGGVSLTNGENITETLQELHMYPEWSGHFDNEVAAISNYFGPNGFLYHTRTDITV